VHDERPYREPGQPLASGFGKVLAEIAKEGHSKLTCRLKERS
jgi:hypothetical protein